LEYYPNLVGRSFSDPISWAKEMEAQGWHGICASDHTLLGENGYPHVFVTATAMACATSKIQLTTSFCNNLFRSPVEFAQAARSLQIISNGRFEAGLGAGWAQEEVDAMGLPYPDAPTRISMYIEALQVVGPLLKTGRCQFKGKYYNVNVAEPNLLGPSPDIPPPLIASAGGPRGIREATPLVDRIEIKAFGRATRGGALNFELMATVTQDEIKENVERVRKVDANIPINIFVMVAAGDNDGIRQLKASMGNGYLANFIGHPDDVARALEDFGSLGIERCQLTEMAPGSHAALAGSLLG